MPWGRWQYPALVEPFPAEPITVEKWFRQLSDPVRRRPIPAEFQAFAFVNLYKEEPWTKAWRLQPPDPVRVRPRPINAPYFFFVYPFTEEPWTKAWHRQQPDPVRIPPRPLNAPYLSFVYPFTEEPWTKAWATRSPDPVRIPPRPLNAPYLAFVAPTITETITVDKWFRQTAEPLRVPPRPLNAPYSSLVYPWTEEPWTKGWGCKLPDLPPRGSPRAAEYPAFFYGWKFAEEPERKGWGCELPDLPILARRQIPSPHLFFVYVPTAAETITVDKWYRPTSEPVRLKPRSVEFPAFSFANLFTEEPATKAWNRQQPDPIRIPSRPLNAPYLSFVYVPAAAAAGPRPPNALLTYPWIEEDADEIFTRAPRQPVLTPVSGSSPLTVSSAGMYVWTAPAGVTSVTVKCWGGGGGGGGGAKGTYLGAGAGGGGGGFSQKAISVTPGANYIFAVGSGGAAGAAAANGKDGKDTFFVDVSTVLAKGGGGGGVGKSSTLDWSASGTPGLSSQGVGTVKYSGGYGGRGPGTQTYSGPDGGGGGGSSGGTGSNGSSGSDGSTGGSGTGGAGGTAPSGGANGGHGEAGVDGTGGENGYVPGAGGGGGGANSSTQYSGMAGASGQVVLSWVVPNPLIPPTLTLPRREDEDSDPQAYLRILYPTPQRAQAFTRPTAFAPPLQRRGALRLIEDEEDLESRLRWIRFLRPPPVAPHIVPPPFIFLRPGLLEELQEEVFLRRILTQGIAPAVSRPPPRPLPFYLVRPDDFSELQEEDFLRRISPRLLDYGRRSSGVRGLYRVFNTAGYRLFRKLGSPPAEGDTPWTTSASLPVTPIDTFSTGTWYISVSYFNGVIDSGFLPVGPAGETYLRLDVAAGGAQVDGPPRGPLDVHLEQRAGGVVRVVAVYAEAGDLHADTWAIGYTTNGVDPVAGSPVATVAVPSAGLAVLSYDLPAQVDGTTVKVRIQTRRGTSYSEGSEVIPVVVAVTGPTAPLGAERWPGQLPEDI